MLDRHIGSSSGKKPGSLTLGCLGEVEGIDGISRDVEDVRAMGWLVSAPMEAKRDRNGVVYEDPLDEDGSSSKSENGFSVAR